MNAMRPTMPRAIFWALTILWSVLALSVTWTLRNISTVEAAITAQIGLRIAVPYAVSAATIVGLLLGYGWIRWLYAIGLALISGAVVFVEVSMLLEARWNTPTVEATVLAVFLLARILAVVLLFQGASKAWFRSMKVRRRGAS